VLLKQVAVSKMSLPAHHAAAALSMSFSVRLVEKAVKCGAPGNRGQPCEGENDGVRRKEEVGSAAALRYANQRLPQRCR